MPQTDDSTSLLVQVVERLEDVKGPNSSGGYTARCANPDHDDQKPSMSVSERGFHCFSCGHKGSLWRLARDLGISTPKGSGSQRRRSVPEGAGITLAELAKAKGLNVRHLRDLGWEDATDRGRNIVRMSYPDESGQVVAGRTRWSLEGDKKYTWRTNDHPIPYGLPAIEDAVAAGYAVFEEGETDYARLTQDRIHAIGIPGANTWKSEWAEYFTDIDTLFVWQEPGRGGRTFAEAIAKDFPDVRIIKAPADAKDPCELGLVEGDNFVARFRSLMASSVSWAEILAEIETEKHAAYVEEAKPLLNDPALLHKFGLAVQAHGLVGEERNVLILYLALKTRKTARPTNVVVKGPSSSGKSTVVDTVVMFEPEEFVHTFTSHSERSLIYSPRDFQHTFIYYQEASGIGDGDGIRGSIIRSIAAKSDIRYEVTVKDGSGGYTTQEVFKPGPVGILLTTIDPALEQQLETRLLTLESRVTEPHLRDILRFIGRSMNSYRPPDNLGIWHALSHAVSVRTDVDIEFGEWLADRMKIYGPRVHRDFESLLRLVQASAIVHQFQRSITAEGKIQALVADYAHVHTLMRPIFESLQREGLAEQDAAVFDAIKKLEAEDKPTPISQRLIAEKLGIARTSISYRIRKLALAGYVVNKNADTRGKIADYRTSASLPGEATALPDPAELAEAYPRLSGPWVHPIDGTTHPSLSPRSHSSTYPQNDPSAPVPRDSEVDEPPPSTSRPLSPDDATAVEGDSSAQESDARARRTQARIVARASVVEIGREGASVDTQPHGTGVNGPPEKVDELDEQLRPPSGPHDTGFENKVDESSQEISSGCVAQPSYRLVVDEDEALEVCQALATAPFVGLDIETTGVDPMAADIRLVQLATPTEVVIFHVFKILLATLIPSLTAVLEGGPLKIGHNLAFEMSFLLAKAVQKVWPVADTMLVDQVLKNRGFGRSLKDVVVEYLGEELDKTWQKSNWAGSLSEEQLEYAAKDAAIVLPLYRRLIEAAEEAKLTDTMAIDCAALNAVIWMKDAGVLVDHEAWSALAHEGKVEVSRTQEELNHAVFVSLPGEYLTEPSGFAPKVT